MEEAPLEFHQTTGAQIESLGVSHWRLSIDAGKSDSYRLVQIDDYRPLKRCDFSWHPPCTLILEARASDNDLPGTWGFGLWNDPLDAGLANGGTRLLPALPQSAWFFFASDANYLSFRNDCPASGPLAGGYRAQGLPVWPFVPLGLAAPLLLFRPFSRLARKIVSKLIDERLVHLSHDATGWHEYRIEWLLDSVCYYVDQQLVLESEVSPRAPLGLVIWLDNQFAAWRPDGRMSYGTLETSPAWIEIRDLRLA